MKKSNMTGDQIKQIRNHFGLTQKECANRLGVGIRMWQKYEAGHSCKEVYLDAVFKIESIDYAKIPKAYNEIMA